MIVSGRTRGFTLIELLVVVVLIALLTTFALLSMPATSTADFQREEAERLLARLELAREEAMLQARPVGLEITREGYRFVRLEEGQWHGFDARHPLRSHEIEDGVRLDVRVEGVEIELADRDEEGDEDNGGPQILFLPGGEVMPDYTLYLLAPGSGFEVRIGPGEARWFEREESGA